MRPPALGAEDVGLSVRGHIRLDTEADGRVYDNRHVIWSRIAWGRMRGYEVHEDTEETRRVDECLAAHGGG